MTYTAHNNETGETLTTNNPDAALRHIGRHVHVTDSIGFTAFPMSFLDGSSLYNKVVFWSELTGQVRHRIKTGRPQGTVKGWITRS